MKLVINDSKNAKSYQKEIAPEKATQLIGKKIGEKFDGSIADLPSYSLQITGGSDRDGFPMRKEIPGVRRARIMLSSPPGIRFVKKGQRRVKPIVGNTVSQTTSQLNAKVTEYGPKTLEELGLTLKPKEQKTAEKKEKEEKKGKKR